MERNPESRNKRLGFVGYKVMAVVHTPSGAHSCMAHHQTRRPQGSKRAPRTLVCLSGPARATLTKIQCVCDHAARVTNTGAYHGATYQTRKGRQAHRNHRRVITGWVSLSLYSCPLAASPSLRTRGSWRALEKTDRKTSRIGMWLSWAGGEVYGRTNALMATYISTLS